MTANETRQKLKEVYLVDFPEDLFQFWEFTQSFGADNPLQTFEKPMGLRLEGPFGILAGELPTPDVAPYLAARYYDDPPEFWMIFSGDTDGLHWGYWFDDPDKSPADCVASYYSRDAYEITEEGATLFDAFRLALERSYASTLENIETDPDVEKYREEYEADLEAHVQIRSRLMQFSTADRLEIGDEYEERYAGEDSSRRITAETFDGMGIVVPVSAYRPLSVDTDILRANAINGGDLTAVVAEAYRALEDGFPGTALALGKNLWIGNPPQKQEAYALLEKAYAALNRPTLKTILGMIALGRTT